MQRSTVGYNSNVQDYKSSEYGKVHESNKVHNYNKVHQYGSVKEYKPREYKPTSIEYKPTNYNKPRERKIKRLKTPVKRIERQRKRIPEYRPAQIYKYKTIAIGPEYKLHDNVTVRNYEGTEYRPRPYDPKYREYESTEYRPPPMNYKLTRLNYYGFYDPHHGENVGKPRSADKVSVSDVKVHPDDENIPPNGRVVRHPPPGYQQHPDYRQAAVVGAAAMNTQRRPLNDVNDYKIHNYDKYHEYNTVREYKPHQYNGYRPYDKIHEYNHIHWYWQPNTGGGTRRNIIAAQAVAADSGQKAKVAKERDQKESGLKMKPAHEYKKIHQYDKIHEYQGKPYEPTQLKSAKLGNDKLVEKSVSGGPSAATMLMAGAAGGAVAGNATRNDRPQNKKEEQKPQNEKTEPKPQNTNSNSKTQPRGYNRGGIVPAVVAGGAAAGVVAASSQPHPNKVEEKKKGEGKSKNHAFNDWDDQKKKTGPTAAVIPVSNSQRNRNTKPQENTKKEETAQQTRAKTPPQKPTETRTRSPPRNTQHHSSNNYQPRNNGNTGIITAAALGAGAGAATGVAMSKRRSPSPIPQNTRKDSPPPQTRPDSPQITGDTQNTPIITNQSLAAATTGAAAATMIQPSNRNSNNKVSPSKVPVDDWADTRAPSPKRVSDPTSPRNNVHPTAEQQPYNTAAKPNTDSVPSNYGLPPQVQAAIRAYDEAHSRKINTPQVPVFKDEEHKVSSIEHVKNNLPRDVIAKMHAYNRIRVH